METLIRNPAFVAVVLLAVAVEAVWRTRIARRGYDARGALASFGVAVGNFVFQPLNAAIVGAVFLSIHASTPLRLSMEDWRVWFAAFVLVEFCYYWFHRWSHLVRWLWASHAVHHSATEMTLPAAVRLGWTGALSGGWLVFVPLVALGFPPTMILTLLGANLAYQFFLHTEWIGRLGVLEWVLNTPAHHRVHHGSNAAYLDKNFGGVVIVFDRLFGTFAAVDPADPIRYGLTSGPLPPNPVLLALGAWADMGRDALSARSIRALWTALFGRPTSRSIAMHTDTA